MTGRLRSVPALLVAGAVAAGLLTGCGAGDDDAGAPVPSPTSSAPVSTSESSSAPSSRSPQGAPSTAPDLPPPYVDHVEWVQTEVGPSLQIHPTPAGRRVAGVAAGDEAWQEVLTVEPDADSPGMRAQFDCHWTFARLVDPNKTSWNLEPERPVVDESQMIASRCNPGFAEER